ncbi:MAG: hypothetical protein AB7P37_20605 [Ramlibacter sp.]
MKQTWDFIALTPILLDGKTYAQDAKMTLDEEQAMALGPKLIKPAPPPPAPAGEPPAPPMPPPPAPPAPAGEPPAPPAQAPAPAAAPAARKR